jgi:hypothetical protein
MAGDTTPGGASAGRAVPGWRSAGAADGEVPAAGYDVAMVDQGDAVVVEELFESVLSLARAD